MLAEIAEGKSNTAIAESLVLTKRAVEKHINSIFMKLGLAAADDVSKRVKATLMFLAEPEPATAASARRGEAACRAHTGTRHCAARSGRLGLTHERRARRRRRCPLVLIVRRDAARLPRDLRASGRTASCWTPTTGPRPAASCSRTRRSASSSRSSWSTSCTRTSTCRASIEEALPPRAAPLAGPAAGRAEGLARARHRRAARHGHVRRSAGSRPTAAPTSAFSSRRGRRRGRLAPRAAT